MSLNSKIGVTNAFPEDRRLSHGVLLHCGDDGIDLDTGTRETDGGLPLDIPMGVDGL